MKDYDQFAETFSASRKNMRWSEIDFLLEHLFEEQKFSRSASLLDVWCGNGRLLEHLSRFQYAGEYLGVDASSWMIEEAKKLHQDQAFEVLDMANLDKVDKHFDIVCFIASFHHLKEYKTRMEVLKKAKKLLKDGGVIAMTNWNLFSNENRERYKKAYRGNGDFDIKIGEYVRYYHAFELHELDTLFNEAGMKVYVNTISEGERNIISIIGNS